MLILGRGISWECRHATSRCEINVNFNVGSATMFSIALFETCEIFERIFYSLFSLHFKIHFGIVFLASNGSVPL